jgi:arsenate reductase (thioredoxin)
MGMRNQHAPWKILFVCVGNSCRSQMAEAFANQRGGGAIRAWSAGSLPLGSIVPRTRAVLEEKGISIQGHWSKGLCDVPLEEMDVIVSMGNEVEFPLPPRFAGRLVEWEISDPYGSDLESYRGIRDLIERKVAALADELQKGGPPQHPDDSQPGHAR